MIVVGPIGLLIIILIFFAVARRGSGMQRKVELAVQAAYARHQRENGPPDISEAEVIQTVLEQQSRQNRRMARKILLLVGLFLAMMIFMFLGSELRRTDIFDILASLIMLAFWPMIIWIIVSGLRAPKLEKLIQNELTRS